MLFEHLLDEYSRKICFERAVNIDEQTLCEGTKISRRETEFF